MAIERARFNPSTQKVAYNPVTGKVQMVKWYIPGIVCLHCAVDGTPKKLKITFHDLVDCDGCHESYRIAKWYSAAGAAAVFNNRTFDLHYGGFCAWLSVGGTQPLPDGPIATDYYNNNLCTNFAFTEQFTHFRILFQLISIVGNTYTLGIRLTVSVGVAGATSYVFDSIINVVIDDGGLCIPNGSLDNDFIVCGETAIPGVGDRDIMCKDGYVVIEGGGTAL